jgi:drug/metabolite transporter (DMT)-like permease
MAELNTTTTAAPAAWRREMVGKLSILLAALLWSASGFFAAHPAFDAWPSESRGLLLAFWRALFAGLLVLPLARRPRWDAKLAPMALAFAGLCVSFLSAMTLTTAANAIWLQNTGPAWVLLFSVFVLRRPARRDDLILVGCGTLGVALILYHELQGQQIVGVLLGLSSGAFYALTILFLRALRDQQAAWLTALNMLATAALLLPAVLVQGVRPSGEQLAILAVFGLFQFGIPYILFAHGLRFVSGPQAAGLALLEPICTPLWVYLAWGQTTRWWTLAGAAFILTGLATQICFARHPHSHAPTQ